MKNILNVLMGRASEAERAMANRLRQEARQIETLMPVDSRRRVMETIARIEPIPGATGGWRWIATGITVAIAVGLAAWMMHGHTGGEVVVAPMAPHQEKPAYVLTLPTAEMSVAVVQRWVQQPMQSELRLLMDGFDSTQRTVRSILPTAPVKQAKDSTGKADAIDGNQAA